MSETESYREDVETFCSKRRCQVLILLRTSQEPTGGMITGVPDSCNFEGDCSKGALCLLKARQITTGRKR
ncbi:MAG: hypothetical protein ABSB71_13255 [Candidatus Bathyarchaeia archaeon]